MSKACGLDKSSPSGSSGGGSNGNGLRVESAPSPLDSSPGFAASIDSVALVADTGDDQEVDSNDDDEALSVKLEGSVLCFLICC